MFSRFSCRAAAATDSVRTLVLRGRLLRASTVAAVLAISACTTDDALTIRPDVDVGTRTAALPRPVEQPTYTVDPAYDADPTYSEQPTAAYGGPQPTTDAAQQPVYQEQATAPRMMGAPPTTLQAQADAMQPQMAAAEPVDDFVQPQADVLQPQTDVTAAPIDIQTQIGATQAQTDTIQPQVEAPQQVAAAIPPGSGLPLAIAAPPETDEPIDADQSSMMSEPTEEPAQEPAMRPVLAAYPRMNAPLSSGPSPMSADEMACRRELKSLGVSYRDLNPIRDSAACFIDNPVKVSILPGNVALTPAATLNCEMALTLAKWTRNELNPAARRRYWSRIKAIHQMSSYSCRKINGSRTMSEHSKGNAIDIGQIELTSGRDIDVEKQGIFSFRSRGFLDSVRSDGCEYFSTVLGPGYNYDHRNHFHFDIKSRRNGRHACH